MKQNIRKKTAALAAAIVMTCSGFGQNAHSALAASLQQEPPSSAWQQNSMDPVPVIVKLNGDAVLEGNDTPDYLTTQDAAAKSNALRRAQDAVISQIREWYPELVVRYRYTTLVNGFACDVPVDLIGQISAMPEVESVSLTGKLKVKKEMATAVPLANIPYFQTETGCDGEGQVIAVIDTELDVTHPMFAPLADNLQKKISKSDLDAIASGVGFNTDFDTDKAYISSKVPFAIDYAEDPYAVANDDIFYYHGTHVCGIAAGNRITDAEGTAMSGVAPDAQIVFMAMDAAQDIEAVLIAEIEDAVKLNVDAINMSLGIDGDPMGDSIITQAVNHAEAAGVTVCIAAGNSDNGTMEYGETHYADNPDVSWMNGFITEGTNALAVASADNPSMEECYCFTLNGELIPYGSYYTPEMDWPDYLYSSLNLNQDYEYVYCGFGREEDFAEDIDLTGKIALIDRGENYFTEKAANARSHGAVAAIIVQNESGSPVVMSSEDSLPIGMITRENGELLKNAENKTIRFSDTLTKIKRSTGISSYTSWGIHSSMELRPDITAVGANVTSAAYGGELFNMSGTSMASPYMAGCAAILKQYLLENGCSLTGSELTRYMRNLLMTSAVPYRDENNMFVTPRRQGAGLVQMDAALRNKVILTGAEGESKLSLRDKRGTQFSFPLTLTNISNEDVSFADARIELTTDAAEYDKSVKKYKIKGQQPLSCSASLNGLKHIAAGETRTETVTVSLDAAQYADLKKIFTSGIFIEGYLLLEGAENSVDISIPMVGFSDNFALIPAFTDDFQALAQINHWTATNINVPLCESVEILLQALNHAENYDNSQPLNLMRSAIENTNEEEFDRLNRKPEALYCSPNNDGIADQVGIYSVVQRHCLLSGLDVLDQNGNILGEGIHNQPMTKMDQMNFIATSTDMLLDDLEEGAYTARLYAAISKEPAEEDIQHFDYPLYIDKTKPALNTKKITQDGKTTITVHASDDRMLDGVIVLGKGDGHVVGKEPQYGKLPKKATIDLAQALVAYQGYEMINGPYSYNQYSEHPITIHNEQLHPFMQYLTDMNTEEGDQILQDFDYAEFIPAGESGKEVTFEYDVTDLSNYEFLALDRAYNVCANADVNENARPNSIEPGVYQSGCGIFIFTEDTVRFIPTMESSETSYHYTVSNGKLKFIGDMEDSSEQGEYELQVIRKLDGSLQIKGELFSMLLNTEFFDTPYEQTIKPVDIEDPEHYFAIHGWDAESNCIEPYVRSIVGNVDYILFGYEYLPDAVVVYDAACYRDSEIVDTVSVTLDLKTGIGTLEDGTKIDFLHPAMTDTGDVNCDKSVDVSDAVLLARLLAEDPEVVISEQGLANADADHNGKCNSNDVIQILRAIAKIISLY